MTGEDVEKMKAAIAELAEAMGTTPEALRRRGRLLRLIEQRCWSLTHPRSVRVSALQRLARGGR